MASLSMALLPDVPHAPNLAIVIRMLPVRAYLTFLLVCDEARTASDALTLAWSLSSWRAVNIVDMRWRVEGAWGGADAGWGIFGKLEVGSGSGGKVERGLRGLRGSLTVVCEVRGVRGERGERKEDEGRRTVLWERERMCVWRRWRGPRLQARRGMERMH